MGIRLGGGSPTGGGREREKKLVVIGGSLLLVVAAWTIGVFVLGVGGGGGGEVASGGRGGGAAPGNGDANPPDGDRARESGTPREGTALEADAHERDYATPEDPEVFMEQERERDVRAQEEPAVTAGGATDEPAGYDPLGIRGRRIPLTPVDRDRVSAAAAKFVTAAYGYSGQRGSREEYLSGINDTVLSPEFYDSEGAAEVRRYSETVQSSGTRSAARMDGFDVESADGDTVEGYAYFATGDSYDRSGDLMGDEKSYRQELTLVRYGAVFRVKAADEVQEVRER